MTSEDIAKKIGSVTEKLDEWVVYVYDMPDGGKSLQINLDYTPYGQDFSFDIEVETTDTLEDVIKKIEDYVEGYDPDYETSLNIKDGHGINGAPYHLRDILDDMEYVQGELKKLAKVIRVIS